VSGVKDIVRAMVVLNNMDDLNAVIKCLIEMHNQEEFEIVRKKDRHVEAPSSGGWRDLVTFFNSSIRCFLTFKSMWFEFCSFQCRVRTLLITPACFSKPQMVNIGVDGHICEIQIAHQQMLAARKGLAGHAVFNRVRNVMELLDMTL
jgi:hypothetical protein